jgi:phenylacetate-coenzyme A ligase PaaK-like adenylate-forming protein
VVAEIDTQRAALTALLRRIQESPFYRERPSAHTPIDASNDAGTELAQLPLTQREELLRDQLAHLPHGTRRFDGAPPPVRAGMTGSGADLLVLAWSAADLAEERAAGTRVLGALGVRAGMRVANLLPGALATPGSLLLGDVIEDIGALDIPLGVIETDAAARAAWELVDRVEPDIIVFDQQSALRFLTAAPNATRRWWQGLIWLQQGATAVHPPPMPPAAGFTGWHRTWLAIPEARSFVGHSCAASRVHLDAGVWGEIVDAPTGAPLPAGHDGVLALTLLGGDTPLLRYASGVRARRIAPPCSCGTGGFVVELR